MIIYSSYFYFTHYQYTYLQFYFVVTRNLLATIHKDPYMLILFNSDFLYGIIKL